MEAPKSVAEARSGSGFRGLGLRVQWFTVYGFRGVSSRV